MSKKERPKLRSRLAKIVDHAPPAPVAIDCLNCGDAVYGSFCMKCGQAVNVSRYSFHALGNEAYNQFRKFELFAAIRTVMALLRHPGKFIRGFLAGQRVGYLTPLKFFFYTFVLQIFVGALIHTLTGNDTNFLTEGSDLRSQLIDLVSVGFWGLCWRVAFRKSGLNAAENIVAAIYLTGEAFVFTFVVRVVLGPFMGLSPYMPALVLAVDLIIYLAYSFFFSYRLFRDSSLKLIAKQVVLTIVYLLIATVVVFATVFGEQMGTIMTSGS